MSAVYQLVLCAPSPMFTQCVFPGSMLDASGQYTDHTMPCLINGLAQYIAKAGDFKQLSPMARAHGYYVRGRCYIVIALERAHQLGLH